MAQAVLGFLIVALSALAVWWAPEPLKGWGEGSLEDFRSDEASPQTPECTV